MTTADGWVAAVRSRTGLGVLLPLGGPEDGAWIAARAVDAALRGAARQVEGVTPGRVRITPAGAPHGTRSAGAPDGRPSAFPAPPGSLPPGPLRIEMDFAAGTAVPLPALADRLRAALWAASERRLGLIVSEVDLRVTDLADGAPREAVDTAPPAAPPREAGPGSLDDPVAGAAAGVEGVDRLTTVLGPPVHRAADHVRVELATAPDHRPLDVARAVRGAVREQLPVTVVVTGA
ncbi:hypothetical protein [Streptomyces sp. NPDC015131]|uniref:hypothetical protein n=1 Tax=Streptomyces sp. NPDC015131 TaxID=3364941 RepID=UPI0036F6E0B4